MIGAVPAAAPGEFLTRERIRAWATVLLVAEAGGLLFLALRSLGSFLPAHPPVINDFVSFYSAGAIAAGPHPQDAYDPSLLHEMEQHITRQSFSRFFFFYPPVYLLLCRLIAIFPYFTAYTISFGVGFALYLASAVLLWPERRDRGMVLLLAAAFPAAFLCAGLGQNGLLTAALFGFGAVLFRAGKPFAAGAALGLLCYKPHFGILLPVAFLAARQWKAIAGAAFLVIALALLSAMIFGRETWHTYFDIVPYSREIFRNGIVRYQLFISPYAFFRSLGASDAAASPLQLFVILAMAAIVVTVWRKETSWDQRFAVLIPATLIAMPVILFYDMIPLAIAGLLAVRASRNSRDTDALRLEKIGGAALFAAFLLLRPLSIYLDFPTETVIPPLCLLLILRTASKRESEASC